MRRRILLVITLTLVVIFGIIFAATRLVILESSAALERRSVQRDVSRLITEIYDEQGDLVRTATDWGEWDDSYSFIRTKDPDFAERNLSESAISTVRADLIIYSDLSGRAVFARAVGEIGQGQALEELETWLRDHPDVLQRVREGFSVMGIANLPAGPVMVGIHRVTNSAGTAPSRGSLLVGRWFDVEEVRQINQRLQVIAKVYKTEDPGAPADVRSAAERLTPLAPILVRSLSRETVAGYAVLRDPEGRPALVARVEVPREIYWLSLRSLWYITGWLLITGVVFGAVVLVFLQRSLFSRLHSLSSAVLRIGTSQDFTLRTALRGTDELAYLGAAINGMLEALEKSTAELRQSESRNEAFLAAFPDALFRLRQDGTLLDYRLPADAGYSPPAELMGKSVRDAPPLYGVVGPEVIERALEALRQSASSGAPAVFEFDTEVEGMKRIFEARVVAAGASEAIAFVHDVTARRKVEETQRKEILLKEIHHRVKNNLQVISSLLDLQARAAKDPNTARLLRESNGRVRSMSLIHEKLYQSGGDGGVQFSEYVRDLTTQLCHSFACTPDTVSIAVDVEDMSLDMDTAVPLGIIINELLTNALKYAFPDGGKGLVRISLYPAEEGMLELHVRDDGAGFPAGLDYRSPTTLGLRIVNTLVTQLRGTLTLQTEKGTDFIVSFPAP